MSESLRSNEAPEWRYGLGATVKRLEDGREFVVVEQALQLGLSTEDFEAAYVLAERRMAHVTWVMPAWAVHDRYAPAQASHYEIGKLNPTTWAVAHAGLADGRGLHHVVSQCDSLVAAQRLLVTLELQRRVAA